MQSRTVDLKVSGLGKKYGEFIAIADVSFSVGHSRSLALLGPSGCGKSTILRCIAGLETPETGRIQIGDTVVFDAAAKINLQPELRGLGIVFQSYAVWPHMTVAENVGFPLMVRGLPRHKIDQRVGEILDIVGLADWRHRSATALSGGQQQRVALARAIVHEPELVLFDEPMSNLDAQRREDMRLELKLLQEKVKFTSIYVTHDQSEAFSLADEIMIMDRGVVQVSGGPEDIFRRPATPFVARFFGFNVLSGKAVAVIPVRPGVSNIQVNLPGDIRIWGVHEGERALGIGDDVVLCVRREHVRIDEPAGIEGMQSVPGLVKARAFLGMQQETLLRMGDMDLRAIHAPTASRSANVTVSFLAADCAVLPDDGRIGLSS